MDASSRSASDLLGSGPVTPNTVRQAFESVTQLGQLAVFIDEFDRLRDPDIRRPVRGHDQDALRSRRERHVFLIGVADSVGELIREHRSIERALAQIHMPRMTPGELSEIATRGIATARMEIAGGAVRKITTLSQGLPHYTQLLTQLAAQAALGRRRPDVTSRDVDAAVARAIDRAQQSIVEAYRDATVGEQRSIYPALLLACALADEDEFGFFAASDVRDALGRILDKPPSSAACARQLDELSRDDRGAVLQKHGPAKAVRYRFVDPLLQPYVAMRGVSEGVVRVQDLN